MKKILSAALAALVLLSLCACGSAGKKETAAAGSSSEIANPVTECSQKELLKRTGMDFTPPEGAENNSWSYIESENGDVISQLSFTLDDNEFCYRAKPSEKADDMAGSNNENADVSELEETLNNGVKQAAELSGLNYDWKTSGSTMFGDYDAVYALNEGKQGFLSWYDDDIGVLYSLSMDDNCTQPALESTADKCYTNLNEKTEKNK